MANRGPTGPDVVSALAAMLARAVASALIRASGVPTEVAAAGGVRSTWGAFRPTLSRAAHAIVLSGVPGGVVVDADQVLASRAQLSRAASAAIREALTPPERAGPAPPAERARLAEDVGVLVLAFELRQGRESWRMRVCLPANTLRAVVANLAPAPPTPPAPAVSPRTEVLRELARQDPAAVSDLIKRWIAEDEGR
jgi:hypothetical protein